MKWFAKIEDVSTFARLPGALHLLEESAKATDGCLAVQDIIGLTISGAIQLWAGGDKDVHGVLLSEARDFPQQRVFYLFGLATDDFAEFSKHLPEVEAYGLALGCPKAMTVNSREGLKKLPGYQMTGICLTKDLHHERAVA